MTYTKRRDPALEDPIEYTDPITGEINELVPEARIRIRNVFIDDLGREIPDPRPMAPPIGYQKPLSMVDLVRQQIQREMALYASHREAETFEDADDFDVGDADDMDPHSQWENEFDPPWSEVRAAVEADRAQREAQRASPTPPAAPSPAPSPAAPSAASAAANPPPASEPGA